MSKLATSAEILKLGQALGVEPAALGFLEGCPAEQLRHFREAVYERLFDQDVVIFQRLVKAFRRVPIRIVAFLCEHVFGPLLCARVAGEFPVKRSVKIAQKVSTALIVDACVELDPRRAPDFIRQIPTETLLAVAREIIARREFMTVGRLLDLVPDEALRRAIEDGIVDDEATLRIAFFMDSRNRIDHIARMMPPQRLRSIVLRARDESKDLWPEVLAFVIHASYGLKREMAEFLAEQDDALLTGLVRATQARDLWVDVLPVVALMSEASQRKIVNLPVLKDPAVQESIVRAADERDLWGTVLPMVAMMQGEMRAAVAQILAAQVRTRDTLARAADGALLGEHWEPLLDIVSRMPRVEQEEFVEIVRALGEVDPDLLQRIARRAEDYGFGEPFR